MNDLKLHYISNFDKGISRKKNGNSFIYYREGKVIKDETILKRIKSLVIPPAWQNVWICPDDNGHLQATGIDSKGRKQYKYHPLWSKARNENKFTRLRDFGKHIPLLRLKVEQDLSQQELNEQKVIATVIALMERTFIRVGNSSYEKAYGSYGLTTLKDKHVKINGSKLLFAFKGKKGIYHKVTLQNKRLAKVVKQCRDIPGKELFQYISEDGSYKSIDSGKVNNYIKAITHNDFTAKDLRTWAGTLNALRAFKDMGEATTNSECKKCIIEALEHVSKQLGNTRTVCKKYYVHPLLLKMYENKKLGNYLKELDNIERDDNYADLTTEEKVLMKILKRENQLKEGSAIV